MRYRIGSRVEVFDGSYSMTIEGERLRHSCGAELIHREFVVIGRGRDLPVEQNLIGNEKEVNEVILQATDNGQIVFIQDELISPYEVKRSCETCANYVPKGYR